MDTNDIYDACKPGVGPHHHNMVHDIVSLRKAQVVVQFEDVDVILAAHEAHAVA